MAAQKDTVPTPVPISTTPPPIPGHPPLRKMDSLGNAPIQSDGQAFDIVTTYYRLLSEDPDLTMPVAAIESLILLLAQSRAATVFETLDLIKTQSDYLKSQIPNSISLSAGTDLFQRYMISSLKPSSSTGSFDQVRAHLLNNGRLFVSRAKAGRERIAGFGQHFVRDGSVVLTMGGSRVVGALLKRAAEARSAGAVNFKVIYVMSSADSDDSDAIVKSLRSRGVPVATIGEGAVGYAIQQVSLCIVGAEGVVENGGIISRLGTYQIASLAKSSGKPFYVAAESHKFVRMYPLDQYDLGMKQNIVEFRTSEEDADPARDTPGYFGRAQHPKHGKSRDAVDFTPPSLIAALITESGVLTPSAVSEELISVWF